MLKYVKNVNITPIKSYFISFFLDKSKTSIPKDININDEIWNIETNDVVLKKAIKLQAVAEQLKRSNATFTLSFNLKSK